jgi:shikimate kinase
MTQKLSNIVLIGMPGSGKSTVGVILAKKTARDFVDTDVLIQTSHERTLQEIVDTDGYMALRKIEEDFLLGLNLRHHVIATGGSAVYSHQAMTQLKMFGVVIFLNVDLATLESRVLDFSKRGLSKRPGQSLSELFDERFSLYTKHADITINCIGMTQDEVCASIIEQTAN